MPRLRQRDLATFSKVLEALYADGSSATLLERALASLHGLVSCEFASFSLLDARIARWHSRAMTPGVTNWPGMEIYQHFYWEDALVRHFVSTGATEPRRISDFVGLREYRASGVYSELFGRVGCDRRMGFGVLNHPALDMSVSLNRSRRDFTEEERGLLALLQPHLILAYSQANAQQAVLRERARLGDAFGVGLIEINGRAQPLWVTPRAGSLMMEFFPGWGHGPAGERLPAELQTALGRILLRQETRASDKEPFQPWAPLQYFPGPDQRRLKVRLVRAEEPGQWYLLLEEAGEQAPIRKLVHALHLTPREAEVLYWLKEGKSNWGIAAILGNAEKTVGKHLENIFRKLQVENRTAAVRVATETCLGG